MKKPDEIIGQLRTRWARQWPEWLGGGGTWPQRFALSPPVEDAAHQDWLRFAAWLEAWKDSDLGHVERVPRRWPTLGAQELPTHVRFDSAAELIAALGVDASTQFARADARWRERAAAWPAAAEALRRIAGWLAATSDADYARFVSVVDWLVANPASGLRLRQIPVRGLHSKWLEANTAPVGHVLAALQGVTPGPAFERLAGLTVDPPRRRFRLLDPALRAALGGLDDITLGLPRLAQLELPVQAVLIVENLQTALAFGDIDGVLLLFGAGYSVSDTGAIPWMASVPILYWGDIDNAGFGILHTLRSHHPHACSILMDEESLLHNYDMHSSDESKPGATLPLLTDAEQALYAKLGAGAFGPAFRIEQERMDWAWAEQRARAAIVAAIAGRSNP